MTAIWIVITIMLVIDLVLLIMMARILMHRKEDMKAYANWYDNMMIRTAKL